MTVKQMCIIETHTCTLSALRYMAVHKYMYNDASDYTISSVIALQVLYLA